MDHTWFEHLQKTPLAQTQLKGVSGKVKQSEKSDQPSMRGLICFDVPVKEIAKTIKSEWNLELSDSHRSLIENPGRNFLRVDDEFGVTYLAWVLPEEKRRDGDSSRLTPSDQARARDLLGDFFQELYRQKPELISLSFSKASVGQIRGALLAADLAFYSYKKVQFFDEKNAVPRILLDGPEKLRQEDLDDVRQIALATNLARHLCNLPANILHPRSYAEFVKELFAGSKSVDVEVWTEKRLKREKMNLMVAVGRGAEFRPRLVHIKYRPKDRLKQKPIAFVGKGVTFDSGGLDVKSADGMRIMKKDMGGSASVLASAFYADQTQVGRPLDFYLALAENAIDEHSYRPGDVYRARNGMTVEIHNTDAEGRLVLADALDVALREGDDEAPEVIVDVATLTGAIKVGLGPDVAGLFCNNDGLAGRIMESAIRAGEPTWRMPLFQNYRAKMISPVADMVNSVDGFGGAINGALFLESFVKGRAWAHLDIYAWKDKPGGVFSEMGGSGQMVQTIVEFLRS